MPHGDAAELRKGKVIDMFGVEIFEGRQVWVEVPAAIRYLDVKNPVWSQESQELLDCTVNIPEVFEHPGQTDAIKIPLGSRKG
jgi:hypothetical protein